MSFRDLLFGDVHSASSRGACGGCRRSCATCGGGLGAVADDRTLVRKVQTALFNLARQYDPGDPMFTGLNPGTIDGIYGKDTRRAVSVFQGAKGMKATGELDAATLEALGLGPSDVAPRPPAAPPPPARPQGIAPPPPPAPQQPPGDSSTGIVIGGAAAAALLLMLLKRRRG